MSRIVFNIDNITGNALVKGVCDAHSVYTYNNNMLVDEKNNTIELDKITWISLSSLNNNLDIVFENLSQMCIELSDNNEYTYNFIRNHKSITELCVSASTIDNKFLEFLGELNLKKLEFFECDISNIHFTKNIQNIHFEHCKFH